jgi:hypothetical protein
MTLSQKSLIWREWAKASAWLLAHGVAKDQLEAKRHQLIAQANGSGLSMADWKRWTNSQVDKVLAKFRAVYDGGNLDAQIKAQEQPEERRRALINRCHLAAQACITKGGDEGYNNDMAQRYLDGTAKKICGVYFRDLDDGQLAKVMGALERSAVVKRKNAAAAAVPAAASEKVDPDCPF